MEHHSTSTETWRAIRGYVGRYEISDCGRVRSFDGRIKSARPANGGHLYVELWMNGTRSRKYVHRLVITEFVGPGEYGQEVRHLNGNPRDNQVANLEWGTRSENMMDEVNSGRHWQTRKTHCKQGHEFTPENTIVRGRKRTQRTCRTCNERWQAAYRAKAAAPRTRAPSTC